MKLNLKRIETRTAHFELEMPKPLALRCAINEERIRKALSKKTLVHLTFEKLNGEIRSAYATTKIEYIPKASRPNGRGAGYTEMQVRFFDTYINEWRSCLLDKIIDVN